MNTGSSDTFLPAVGCDATCNGHTLYNPAASSTAVNTTDRMLFEHREIHDNNHVLAFFLQFGAGNATGFIVTDTVAIAGVTARAQAVGSYFATCCYKCFNKIQVPRTTILWNSN